MKSQWLACTSDRSTIHIFTVKLDPQNAIKLTDEEAADQDDDNRPENKKSRLNLFKGIHKYFDSEWSYARFKVPNEDNSVK